MNRSRSIKSTNSKHKIIQIIWQDGPSAPYLINDRLNKKAGGVKYYAGNQKIIM